ncbi:hypothetical protein W97_06292 [Coniosporium apollinis CBS 100218]|uniref:C2H2-type domain-containing protein n=1 Tax=Coniosporium apollinis (strain CBS 100218) TaxID=1168221 RepID=R7YYM4_CONA1|nr:uncharacterized protein W97_06292 [Coniosporium apollinis CBS 100218]EON66889.1 hypothetical protein W97_06292 [Coniosporium apollinis CBS 100218]
MELNFDWPPLDAHEGVMNPTYDWSPFSDMHERDMQTPFASASDNQSTHAFSELQQGNLAPACSSAGTGTLQPLDQAIQAALAALDNAANPPNQHICFEPGCKKNQFTRDADLQRHIKTVHTRDEAFYCEVDGCPRSEVLHGVKKPFWRADKMKEHMRTVHGVTRS